MALQDRLAGISQRVLKTLFTERRRLQLRRLFYTYYPAYFGTGVRVEHVAPDHREIRISLPLNWRTRNVHGTLFGGSIYGAVDPIYGIMLMERLEEGYEAWVKSATVEFHEPGRSTLYATVRLDDEELRSIENALQEQPSIDRTKTIEFADDEGTVHATIEETFHIRRTDDRGT